MGFCCDLGLTMTMVPHGFVRFLDVEVTLPSLYLSSALGQFVLLELSEMAAL
jgi:hypothetical protein